MIGLGGPVELTAAVDRLRVAADRGHATAMTLHAQLMAAGAGGLRRDFDRVLSRLVDAARLGDPAAGTQLAILVPNVPDNAAVRTALMRTAAAAGEPLSRIFLERSPQAPPSAPLDWEDVQARVSWPHERSLPDPEVRSERPRIFGLRGLFSAEECI
jgi:TPR repeat protein